MQRYRAFLNEIEQLKLVERRNRVADRSRFENSAEHSWNVALMAHVLAEFAPAGTDIHEAVLMLLIHDLVEIGAGDTWAYAPEAGTHVQEDKERVAAQQLFATLPPPLGVRYLALWETFNARETPTARYAAAIDALQPLHNHVVSGGFAPGEPRPSEAAVRARKEIIRLTSPALWEFAEELIAASTTRGTFTP